MGSEFLGKRSASPSLPADVASEYYMEKKMGSEFLGRR